MIIDFGINQVHRRRDNCHSMVLHTVNMHMTLDILLLLLHVLKKDIFR